jgi:hypothetical protein
LLSTDRSDVPTGLVNMIGAWDITSDFSFGTATLELRYDDALASLLGVTESNLKLWHYTGGAWTNITASVDTINKTITGLSVTSFSPFAIAEDLAVVPEPSTILLFVAGAGVLWLRRRRFTKQ